MDTGFLSRIETENAMRIGETKTTGHGRLAAPEGLPQPAEQCRALVPLAPPAPAREPAMQYRQAAFIAHLLAMKDQHGQTRARRRAEPSEAIAAYRATAARVR